MLPAIGLGLGAIGTIGKMIGRGKANKQMRQLMRTNPQYKANPLVAERLGYAKTLLNARAPGAANAENNIFANQATAVSNMGKGATDASQFLALAGNSQGQTNEALNQLGQQETADSQRRYGNLVGAQDAQVNEDDKVYNDQVRRFQDNAQLQGQIQENKQNNWGDVAGIGFGLADYGMASGMGSMFGGGSSFSGAGRAGSVSNPYNHNLPNPQFPQNPTRRSIF
jgi:hypothetical protein